MGQRSLRFDVRSICPNTQATNRAAQATVAAFHEIGEHLGAIGGGHLLPGDGLSEGKLLLERDVIKRALKDAEGSVTYAARSLGISFQALNYMLKTRHKDLLKYRTPVRRRAQRSD